MACHPVNIEGIRFNALTVVSAAGWKGLKPLVKCLCDCGNTIIVQKGHVTSSHTKSCGCLFSHGMIKTKEYKCWDRMKQRCYVKNNDSYKRYGGRGIEVCDRWRKSFVNFFNDMGLCHKGYSLDRINNDGNYSPENCKWSTTQEQARNMSTNVYYENGGIRLIISDWAKLFIVPYSSLYGKIQKGGFDTACEFYKKQKNIEIGL